VTLKELIRRGDIGRNPNHRKKKRAWYMSHLNTSFGAALVEPKMPSPFSIRTINNLQFCTLWYIDCQPHSFIKKYGKMVRRPVCINTLACFFIPTLKSILGEKPLGLQIRRCIGFAEAYITALYPRRFGYEALKAFATMKFTLEF
jgi:hypothetical protein